MGILLHQDKNSWKPNDWKRSNEFPISRLFKKAISVKYELSIVGCNETKLYL